MGDTVKEPLPVAPPVSVPAPAPPAPARPPFSSTDARPAPAPAAPRLRVLLAVLAAAVLGAGSVTPDQPGLGWLLTGVAVAAVAMVAAVEVRTRAGVEVRTRAGVEVRTRAAVERCLWAAAAIALLAVGTVRAAGWLYALCVPMAVICAVQALVGGASLRTMLTGPATALRALPWAARGVRESAPPARLRSPGRLLASIGVSALLLLVFGALLASADDVFAGLLGRLSPRVDPTGAPRWLFLFAAVALIGLATAYLVVAPPDLAEPGEPRRPLRLVEWALPVAVLDGLFAVFVLVQITVLFGGRQHVLQPGGPDFAQYARGGFWQLLVVTALTLAVIGVVARAASRTGRADRVAIRVLVGALAALTLVIVASAVKRLGLYEEAYGYTRLRLVVGATELWLGLLFGLVLLAGVRLRARWLPRAVLASAVVGLLTVAAVNPDRFIAARNVDRFERTGRIDSFYLSILSADAAVELARLPEYRRACALERIADKLGSEHDSWYSYNAGRARARTVPIGRCELP
jgi:hypothetical protein